MSQFSQHAPINIAKRILILGNGAREHALAMRLAVGDQPLGNPHLSDRLIAVAPGNTGIAQQFLTYPAQLDDVDSCLAAIQQFAADLVIVGPEQPLALGLVDQCQALQIPIVGPTQNAARLESSKIFTKNLCRRLSIPTAGFQVCHQQSDVVDYVINHQKSHVAVKADGLCGGKGVLICHHQDEILAATQSLFDAYSRPVVIEDFLDGQEVSLIALCDGEDAIFFAPTQDHKKRFDGEMGPNTGGMGAIAPVFVADVFVADLALQRPTAALSSEAHPRATDATEAAQRANARDSAGTLASHPAGAAAATFSSPSVVSPSSQTLSQPSPLPSPPSSPLPSSLSLTSASASPLLPNIRQRILRPLLEELRIIGAPYRGFLYLGLMLQKSAQAPVDSYLRRQTELYTEPMLLECNVRFGDPEAQALLMGTHIDFLPFLEAIAHHRSLRSVAPTHFFDEYFYLPCIPTAAIVLAREEYPQASPHALPLPAIPTSLSHLTKQPQFFYAGVTAPPPTAPQMHDDTKTEQQLFAKSGRVLTCAVSDESLVNACQIATEIASSLIGAGLRMRFDIGQKYLSLDEKLSKMP